MNAFDKKWNLLKPINVPVLKSQSEMIESSTINDYTFFEGDVEKIIKKEAQCFDDLILDGFACFGHTKQWAIDNRHRIKRIIHNFNEENRVSEFFVVNKKLFEIKQWSETQDDGFNKTYFMQLNVEV